MKEYKEEIENLKKNKDQMAKKLGEVIVERDWAVGKQNSPQKMFHFIGDPECELELID